MTFWVVRAGRHGEAETYTVDRNVVAIGWAGVGDLSKLTDRAAIQEVVRATYPDETIGTVPQPTDERDAPDQDDGTIDLEQFAADKIGSFISRKFRGHELARLA
jgi:hypothetical protein